MTVRGPESEAEEFAIDELLRYLEGARNWIAAHAEDAAKLKALEDEESSALQEAKERVAELENINWEAGIDSLRDALDECGACIGKLKGFFKNAGLSIPFEIEHCLNRADIVLRETDGLAG